MNDDYFYFPEESSDCPPDCWPPDWGPYWDALPLPAPEITKIVIGELDISDEEKKVVLPSMPENFKDRFPNLELLHLWGIKGLKNLPELPEGLLELDVRQCHELEELPELPAGLEVLVINRIPLLRKLDRGQCGRALKDLSLAKCGNLEPESIIELLNQSKEIEELDLTECIRIKELRSLPPKLRDLRLNWVPGLTRLPELPATLTRLELNQTGIESLPDFTDSLDYIDLRNSGFLKGLPSRLGSPRTLFMGNSGLGKVLPDELFGEGRDFNSASLVLAHFEKERTLEHEVKVILIGNGRAGKSSLARRLSGEPFNENEVSTHGIRLWSFPLDFTPVDEPGASVEAVVNVWDFAGQDLYHHTHRLFYENKAIFLICDTAAGRGSSLKTDHEDDDLLPEGWDVSRNVLYWREQIEALGASPGTTGPPPILVVRTKADRDDEAPAGKRKEEFLQKCGDAINGVPLIDFGAESGEGLGDLTDWLKASVAKVLGARGKREIRVDALAVKNELRALMRENDDAFKSVEKEESALRVPHPTMSLEVFRKKVAEHCAGSIYEKHPEYLLQQWHWGGFLYYRPEHLGDIVLEQRWVIQGIYAGLDREKTWHRLLAKGGRFTLKDLAEWSWNDAGYSEEHQKLFIQFMISCGIIFRFGDREGEDEYLMLNALPEKGSDTERLASDYRGRVSETRRVALAHKSLSRDAVLALLAELGAEWRKSGLLWCWGGQFESFRGYSWEPDRSRSFVHLDWQPRETDSFGGTLAIVLYGDDEEFLNEVLRKCREIKGFEDADFPEIPEPPDKGEYDPLESPDRVGARGAEPGAYHADGIEIGISFAGDGSGNIENWRDLPNDSIERWPRQLTESLVELGFRVEQYRIEQNRDEIDQKTDRKEYLDTLIDKSFVFVFLSWPYLESPWCMYEFMRVWKAQPTQGKQDPGRAKVAAFSDAYFSQTNLKNNHRGRFRGFWNKWYQDFANQVETDISASRNSTIYDASKQASEYAYGEWHEFLCEEENLNRISAAISGEGWSVQKLPDQPSEEQVSEWKNQLMTIFKRVDRLLDLAVEAWDRKEYNLAQRIYLRTVLGMAPDNQSMEEALRAGMSKPIELKHIRNSILMELRELEEEGQTFANWKELADAVAPHPSKEPKTI